MIGGSFGHACTGALASDTCGVRAGSDGQVGQVHYSPAKIGGPCESQGGLGYFRGLDGVAGPLATRTVTWGPAVRARVNGRCSRAQRGLGRL